MDYLTEGEEIFAAFCKTTIFLGFLVSDIY